jgi:hypothetical protein
MHRLESSFNPEATKIVEDIKDGREVMLDQVNLVLLSETIIPEEPTTFDQAGNHKCSKGRAKRRGAITKEFAEMDKK